MSEHWEFYQHYKNGKIYRFEGLATLEKDGTSMVVYQDVSTKGKKYVRPASEFFQEVSVGKQRFERVSPMKVVEYISELKE